MKKENLGIIVGVIAITGAATAYLHYSEAAPTAKGNQQQAPTVVNIVSPQRQDVPVVQSDNGTVSAVSMVDLHPQTTAAIRTVHIKEGQFVKAGELMFSLDDRSDRANVDKAQAQVARDAAALADTERQYKRSQELFAQKFISQSQVDTLKSQLDAARALLAADAAQAKASQVAAGFTSIHAPMAGRVGAINVYAGSLVQPTTSLTTVTQLNPINVTFTLPESALAPLLAAQKAGNVPVQASVGADGKPVNGKLSFIDNTVDASAGTIKVKAVFDNPDMALWPGQYVNTRVTVQTLKDAIVVPQNAIVTTVKGTFVYVMAPDGTANQLPVQRVYGFGSNVAITGLKGDEKVIVEGKQNLRPGAKVKLAGGEERKGAPK